MRSFSSVAILNSSRITSVRLSLFSITHLIRFQYSLLVSWADYLSNNSLSVENQCVHSLWPSSSSDNWLSLIRLSSEGDEKNLTNLSIKGIIALKAMSRISDALQRSDDRQKYTVCAYSRDLFVTLLTVLNRIRHQNFTRNGRQTVLSIAQTICLLLSTLRIHLQ
jgi:hypothetical protein